ncbi:U2 snRNP-associated SURP domain-containing protein, partial [Perkinsus olseni]
YSGLPHAFNEIGLVGGIIILSLVALLALHCMLLLVHCQTYLRDTRSKHAVTYGDVGYYAFGRIGSMLVDICIILTQTGFAVAYLIFISHNVSDIIDDYYLDDKKDSIVSRGLILAVILPPLVILSWLRYLKMLAPFSLLAEIAVRLLRLPQIPQIITIVHPQRIVLVVVVVSCRRIFQILFALFAVFAYDIQSIITRAWSPVLSTKTSSSQLQDDDPSGGSSFISTASNKSLWLNLSRLPYFFGISVYCYEGVGMVMPVKNSMQNPSSFNRIWSSSVILVTTIYCAFGALGLLAFSDLPTIDSIITRALPHDTILTPFIRDPPWEKDAKDPELFRNKWETIKHLRATARILRRQRLLDKYDFTTIEGWNMMFMTRMEEFCAYHTKKDMVPEDRQDLATSIAISVLQVDVEELLTFHKSKKQLGRVSRNYVVFEMSLGKPGIFRVSAIRPFRESDD